MVIAPDLEEMKAETYITSKERTTFVPQLRHRERSDGVPTSCTLPES